MEPQENNGWATAATSGSINTIGTGTTTATTYTVPNTGYYTMPQLTPPQLDLVELQDLLRMTRIMPDDATPGDTEILDKLIERLGESDNELQQKAVQHLTFAKAYLEKMMLTAINERL